MVKEVCVKKCNLNLGLADHRKRVRIERGEREIRVGHGGGLAPRKGHRYRREEAAVSICRAHITGVKGMVAPCDCDFDCFSNIFVSLWFHK